MEPAKSVKFPALSPMSEQVLNQCFNGHNSYVKEVVRNLFGQIQEARSKAIRAGNEIFEGSTSYQKEGLVSLEQEIVSRGLEQLNRVMQQFFKSKFSIDAKFSGPFNSRFCQVTSKRSNKFLKANSEYLVEYIEKFNRYNKPVVLRISEEMSKIIGMLNSSLESQKDHEEIRLKRVVCLDPQDFSEFLVHIANELGIVIKLEGSCFYSMFCTFKGSVNAPGFTACNLKPVFPRKIDRLMIDSKAFTDFSIFVGENEFKLHKHMLINCKMFKDIFKNLDSDVENEVRKIEYSTSRAFEQCINHLYFRPISEECLKDPQFVLELFQMSRFLGIPSLVEIAKEALFDTINVQAFLSIAVEAEGSGDSDLKALCKWFSTERIILDKMDISGFSLYQLFLCKRVAQNYSLSKLEKVVTDDFANKIALGPDFINICKYINDNKDKEMKKFLIEALKITEIDLSKRKEEFKEEWKAFKAIMTDISY